MATKSAEKNLKTLADERERVAAEVVKLRADLEKVDPMKSGGLAELEKVEDLLARKERFVRLLDDKLVVARQGVLKEQEDERRKKAASLTKKALKVQEDAVGFMLSLESKIEELDSMNAEIQAVGGWMLKSFDTDIRPGIEQTRQRLQDDRREPVDPRESARQAQVRAIENQERRVAELRSRTKKLRRPYVLTNAIEKAEADLARAKRQLKRIQEAA